MTQTTTPTAPLDAALKIVAELQGMSSENQSLALQFAMQTLRLVPPTTPSAAAPASVHSHILHAQGGADGPGRAPDIKAFTAAKAPKSDQQFCAVAAYFYQIEARESERKQSIGPDDMKEAARLASWPQVKRWAMTLTNAKNAGYLDPAGDGRFRLSSVGENLVAITLPGNGSATGGNGGGRKGKLAKKKSTSKKASKKGG